MQVVVTRISLLGCLHRHSVRDCVAPSRLALLSRYNFYNICIHNGEHEGFEIVPSG